MDYEKLSSCVECDGTDFVAESGYYYCRVCHTQAQDMREVEISFETPVSQKSHRVKNPWQQRKVEAETQKAWTSFEAYNILLRHWVSELIKLGASPKLKDVVLQIWAQYLKKTGIAFISTRESLGSVSVSKHFHLRDIDIIHRGCTNLKDIKDLQKRKRRLNMESSPKVDDQQTPKVKNRKSLKRSFIENEVSNMADTSSFANVSGFQLLKSTSKVTAFHEVVAVRDAADISVASLDLDEESKKYRRLAYKHMDHINIAKLLSIIYLALQYLKDKILLCDILRFIREKHISVYNARSLLPKFLQNDRFSDELLTCEIDSKYINNTSFQMAIYLNLGEFRLQPLMPIVRRFVFELQLPRELVYFIEKLIEIIGSDKVLGSIEKWHKFNSLTPVPEGGAMALIIISLKMLFGIDGETEKQNSLIASYINDILSTEGDSVSLDNHAGNFFPNSASEENHRLCFKEWLGEESDKVTECFVWDKWVRYIEFRNFVMSEEHFPSWGLLHDDNQCGKEQLAEHVFNSIKSEDMETKVVLRKPVKHTQGARKRLSIPILSMCNIQVEEDPTVKYSPTVLPYTKFEKEYLRRRECHKKVYRPDIIPDLLYEDFSSKSLNFIVNPRVYQEFLRKRNIQIEIIEGSAQKNVEKIELPEKKNCKMKKNICHNPVKKISGKVDKEKIPISNLSACNVNERYTKIIEHNRSQKEEAGSERNTFDHITLYLPYTEYWINTSSLSKVRNRQLQYLIKHLLHTLPVSFQWLLENCAKMADMSTEVLYDEVRSIENIILSKVDRKSE